MTVGLAAGPAPHASSEPVSILDVLEEGASGRGWVHFLHDDPEPTPICDLWQASERTARWLAERAGPGSTVAAVLTNTRPAVTALLGALRAGCTVASLPLPSRGMAPAVYAGQLERFCKIVEAQILLLDREHAPLLGDMTLGVPVSTFDDAASGHGSAPLGDKPALVQFTSGSLGMPKGIHLTAHALGAHVLATLAALEVAPGDRSCSWLPLSHDMGLIGQLLAPLCAGAPQYGHHTLTLMTPETFVASPASWLRTCSQTGATITVAPNFALELATRTSARVGPVDLSGIRACIVGSESVRRDTLLRFTEAFSPVGFRPLAFCPAYGMAEATLAVTIVRPREAWRSIPNPARGSRDGAAAPLVCTGSALDGVDVRVAAGEDGIGPIEFRSPSLLDRYIGAELCLTDDGYFVTGDVGLMGGRELFVIGRGDEVIVVGGRNIYPTDIEGRVRHVAIRAGCLAAVAAPDGGLAIVAEPSSATMSTGELEVACRRIRASVARETGVAPATVAFVPRGTLPKTPSGKLRRMAIRRLVGEGDGLLARVDFG